MNSDVSLTPGFSQVRNVPRAEATVSTVSHEVKVGDKVTWVHVRSNGDSMRFTTREGVVTEVYKTAFMIKQRGRGGIVCLPKHRVRLLGEETELTEIFRQMS